MMFRSLFRTGAAARLTVSILAGGLLVGCGTDEGSGGSSSTANAGWSERGNTSAVAETAAPVTVDSSTISDGAATVATPENTPSADASADYAEADSRYQRGDHAGAARLLQAVVLARPDYVPAQYLLGLCQRKAGELTASVAAFREVLRLEPGHLRARVNLARVLIDDKRPREALAELTTSDADSLRSDELWNVRGLAHLDLGELPAAEAAFSRAIEIDPENLYALNNLGLCRIRAGRFQEARLPLEEAASLPGAPAYVFNNLGVARERTGDLGAAADAYAIAVDRGHKFAGLALSRVGDRMESLARSSEMAPGEPRATESMSRVVVRPTPEPPASPQVPPSPQVTEGS